jgi:hypothetical protein
MPAAAFSAWTGIPQQRKWKDAQVIIIPGNGQLTGLPISSNI